MTTIVSKTPRNLNRGKSLCSGPVKAAISVPGPFSISDVSHTEVCNIHLPCFSQSVISFHARAALHGSVSVRAM